MAVEQQFRTNGSEAQFNDITFDFLRNGKSLGVQTGLKSFDYKLSREIGEERDNGSVYVEATTTGEVSCSGSMEWRRSKWDAFVKKLAQLGLGPFSLVADVTLTYTLPDGDVTTVFIERLEITDVDSQNKRGTDPLNITIEFKFKKPFQNGVGPFGEKK